MWYSSNARCGCRFNFSKHDYREVLISNAFSFLSLCFLYRLVPFVVNEKFRLRVCFAYMVFPGVLLCNLVSYSEPVFLAFTIGEYYYWKREKFGYAALLAIFSIFYAPSRGAHPRDFCCQCALRVFFASRAIARHDGACRHRDHLRRSRDALLFYLYRFGNPFIVSNVEAANWKGTPSVANLFNNVQAYGFQAPGLVPFNYAIVPIFLADALLVVATILVLLKRGLALRAYSFVSLGPACC